MEIQYLIGEATSPRGGGEKIIAHICNDLGAWGKGFVASVSRHWATPEAAYRKWHRERSQNDFGLGAIQLVQVGSFVHIANMIAQHGLSAGAEGAPIRYDALEECLSRLGAIAKSFGASVHMPRIGCGSAGGKWQCIEPIILNALVKNGIATFVYDFG